METKSTVHARALELKQRVVRTAKGEEEFKKPIGTILGGHEKPVIKNHSDLKKQLTVGRKVETLSAVGGVTNASKMKAGQIRTVKKVDTTGAYMHDPTVHGEDDLGSHLGFGAAKEWSFDGDKFTHSDGRSYRLLPEKQDDLKVLKTIDENEMVHPKTGQVNSDALKALNDEIAKNKGMKGISDKPVETSVDGKGGHHIYNNKLTNFPDHVGHIDSTGTMNYDSPAIEKEFAPHVNRMLRGIHPDFYYDEESDDYIKNGEPIKKSKKSFDEDMEYKTHYSNSARSKMAKDNHALKDGSFPIANEADLHNAIQAYGRAKDPTAAKTHIIQRAKDLKQVQALPDSWCLDDPDLLKEKDRGKAETLPTPELATEAKEVPMTLVEFKSLQDELTSLRVVIQ